MGRGEKSLLEAVFMTSHHLKVEVVSQPVGQVGSLLPPACHLCMSGSYTRHSEDPMSCPIAITPIVKALPYGIHIPEPHHMSLSKGMDSKPQVYQQLPILCVLHMLPIQAGVLHH